MEAPLSIYPAQTNDEAGHQHEPASLCDPAAEALREALSPTVERVEKGGEPGPPHTLNYSELGEGIFLGLFIHANY